MNIPCLSTTEWHPFSIATSPCDSKTTFHIKTLGEDTFTGRLHKLARGLQYQDATLPTVVVDGPYGVPVDHRRYDRILFVAGGIGITPVLSTFRGLYVIRSSVHVWPVIPVFGGVRAMLLVSGVVILI